MTREEAIKILERRTTIPDSETSWDDINEAIDMAVAALRAKQNPVKLDRSRWEWCNFCSRITDKGADAAGCSFCPVCGRPLTEQAWAELERKIGGNNGTSD